MCNNSKSKLCALFACGLAVLVLGLLAANVKAQSQSGPLSSGTIPCRALEAHSSQQPAVTVVVFHQSNPSDRPKLGSLLRAHSGEAVQFQTADSQWHNATVVRLKSCFGRGVLLFPAGTARLAEKDNFLLRFSPARGTSP